MNDPRFVYAFARGTKVACITCGRTGYDGGSWQDSCRRGHPYVCPECPKAFSSKSGVAAHHRNVHRADRHALYARRASGVRAYWERRRMARDGAYS